MKPNNCICLILIALLCLCATPSLAKTKKKHSKKVKNEYPQDTKYMLPNLDDELIHVVAHNQNVNKSDSNRIFSYVEIMPSFIGGQDSMKVFINRGLVYPLAALENEIEGRVVLRFTVERDSTLSNIRVIRSLDADCDAEAIRIIESMPKWIPGKQNSEIVRVEYTMAIMFKIEEYKKSASQNYIYRQVDEEPVFQGDLGEYLCDNLVRPKKIEGLNLQGELKVKFVVERDGSLTNVMVITPIDSIPDSDIIALMRNMPKFSLAQRGGEAVRTRRILTMKIMPEGETEGGYTCVTYKNEKIK